jgi:hypothetical protein
MEWPLMAYIHPNLVKMSQFIQKLKWTHTHNMVAYEAIFPPFKEIKQTKKIFNAFLRM